MSELTQKLINIQKEIEDSKNEKAVIQGRIQELMDKLKDEWDICSLEEAKREMIKYEKYISKLEKELEEVVAVIKNFGL